MTDYERACRLLANPRLRAFAEALRGATSRTIHKAWATGVDDAIVEISPLDWHQLRRFFDGIFAVALAYRTVPDARTFVPRDADLYALGHWYYTYPQTFGAGPDDNEVDE